MARSWTRLHEHLGEPPGPLTFDMIARVAADRLGESDDLDWKELVCPVFGGEGLLDN